MVDLQDRLVGLAQYNVGFNVNNGYFLVTMTYDERWTVLEIEDDAVECGFNGSEYCYCAPVSEEYMDKVFNSIGETIAYNKDLEDKVALFQEKVKEMQQLFQTEDIETLRTITFKFKKPKQKKNAVAVAVPAETVTPVKTEKTDNVETKVATVVDIKETGKVDTMGEPVEERKEPNPLTETKNADEQTEQQAANATKSDKELALEALNESVEFTYNDYQGEEEDDDTL